MSSSRFISVRPNNVASDQTISYKRGYPVVSWTIPSQNGVLDPRSIRINGELCVYKNQTDGGAGGVVFPGTPVYDQDRNGGGSAPTMDSRLGIYSMWDQLVIRHDKSKQICENIQNYHRYMSSYLGLTSSVQDLTGHMNESSLIQPNAEAMFYNVVSSGSSAVVGGRQKKAFSCYLPCGFLMSGQSINLMENSFGAVTIEIHLTPDNQALFSTGAATANIEDSFYELSNLSLSCEVHDVPAEEMRALESQTTGELEFNTITSLYTTFNSTNAQIQYSLGLRYLQSAFMNFVPSSHINTLQHNGLATTYPSQQDGSLVRFKTVQFLRGGVSYPTDFTIRDNTELIGNSTIAGANGGAFSTGDPQLARMFAESVVPEAMVDKTSLGPHNGSRDYTMAATGVAGSYKAVKDGGALFGLGIRMSQFNDGEDFSQQQFGVALESDLTSDNPMGIYLYFKSKARLVWGPSGVNILR